MQKERNIQREIFKRKYTKNSFFKVQMHENFFYVFAFSWLSYVFAIYFLHYVRCGTWLLLKNLERSELHFLVLGSVFFQWSTRSTGPELTLLCQNQQGNSSQIQGVQEFNQNNSKREIFIRFGLPLTKFATQTISLQLIVFYF